MSKINSLRKGCIDVFHAYLIQTADFTGQLEIPVIKYDDQVPNRLISFSKAITTEDYDQWVHFYEDDCAFERVWNNPRRYLEKLKRFKGVITPDFSLYRDMPLVMQQWNIFRSRALGHWWQDNGIHVLVNVRFGDERTFSLSCDGVPVNGTICVGSHGCIRVKEDRRYFQLGLEEVVRQLYPKRIVVYGTAPDNIFGVYQQKGIEILSFESEYSLSRKQVTG